MRLGGRGNREIRRLSEQEERVAMRTAARGGSRSSIWFRSIARRCKSTITSNSIAVREPMKIVAIRIARSGVVEINHHKSILRSITVRTSLHGNIGLDSSIVLRKCLTNRDHPSTGFEVNRKERRRIERGQGIRNDMSTDEVLFNDGESHRVRSSREGKLGSGRSEKSVQSKRMHFSSEDSEGETGFKRKVG